MNGSVSLSGNTLLSGGLTVNTDGVVEPLNVNINENGDRTITAHAGVDGYNPVNIHVNVPQQLDPVLDDIIITENGTYTPPAGTDGYNDITVNVPSSEPVLDDITITENGTYTPPSGTDGYNDITVNVPSSEPVLDDITITENGTYTPPSGTDGYNDITVNVPSSEPVLDDITITENGTYTPPSGTDGYNDITVNVPTSPQAVIKPFLATILGNGTSTFYARDLNADGCDPITIITQIPTFSVNQITESLELTNEVNVNYNTDNQLQSGHDYLIIANTDLGVRSAIFTYNGATNVVDLLDLGGRFTINMSQSSCYWDWNSGGAAWCSINVFELVSPLLPTHS